MSASLFASWRKEQRKQEKVWLTWTTGTQSSSPPGFDNHLSVSVFIPPFPLVSAPSELSLSSPSYPSVSSSQESSLGPSHGCSLWTVRDTLTLSSKHVHSLSTCPSHLSSLSFFFSPLLSLSLSPCVASHHVIRLPSRPPPSSSNSINSPLHRSLSGP